MIRRKKKKQSFVFTIYVQIDFYFICITLLSRQNLTPLCIVKTYTCTISNCAFEVYTQQSLNRIVTKSFTVWISRQREYFAIKMDLYIVAAWSSQMWTTCTQQNKKKTIFNRRLYSFYFYYSLCIVWTIIYKQEVFFNKMQCSQFLGIFSSSFIYALANAPGNKNIGALFTNHSIPSFFLFIYHLIYLRLLYRFSCYKVCLLLK